LPSILRYGNSAEDIGKLFFDIPCVIEDMVFICLGSAAIVAYPFPGVYFSPAGAIRIENKPDHAAGTCDAGYAAYTYRAVLALPAPEQK